MANLKNQKSVVAVIGGSGFLGSHVADRLSDMGYHVRIYDPVDSPWRRPDQEMIIGDLLNEDLLVEAVAGADTVFNFAALADLNKALDKPVETVRVNILGNVMALEASRRAGVRRFVYASTVYVYSREGGFYRCSKQAAEHYVEEYHRAYGVDYTILRYGSLYGPRSDETNGLFRIVRSAVDSNKIIYNGHADAIREYIHVEDAASASVLALGDDFCNQSVVLTGHEPIKVYDLMKMLSEILGMPNSIKFSEQHDVGHYIRTPYSYQPKLGRKYTPPFHVDLGQGLLQLIDYVRSKMERREPQYPNPKEIR